MLYLKEINPEDWEEEFRANNLIPANENGFENTDYGVTAEHFRNEVIPKRMNQAHGADLPEGFVPSTLFYVWDDDHIVGKVKIRHHLNGALRERGGHIGYCILPPYRGQGFGKEALRLALLKARDLIEEDFVLMSVRKNNSASLHVMLANGARIVATKPEHYLTRINLDELPD